MDWLFWLRPPCLLRSVIVNLTDDPTLAIKGVLWSSRGPWLTLRDVAIVKADLPATRLDGEVIVHRSNVSFLQALP